MPTIYLKATGEALECASVDAREILESSPDLYSATPADPLDHDFDGKKGGSKAEGGDFAGMTVPELKAFAAERNVDLGDATKKADIIAALELAAEEAAKADPAAEVVVEPEA